MQIPPLNDEYTLTIRKEEMDLEAVCEMLRQSYWAEDRNAETVAKSIQHSFCVGIFCLGQQVAFARAITDYATFAFVCDVYVHENHRGKGLGKTMMAAMLSHSDLQNIEVWHLVTATAHGLYEQFGFHTIDNKLAEKIMRRSSDLASKVPGDS